MRTPSAVSLGKPKLVASRLPVPAGNNRQRGIAAGDALHTGPYRAITPTHEDDLRATGDRPPNLPRTGILRGCLKPDGSGPSGVSENRLDDPATLGDTVNADWVEDHSTATRGVTARHGHGSLSRTIGHG